MSNSTNPFKRFFRGLWGAVDATRRVVVNLVFLMIVVLLLVVAFSSSEPEIADTTALVIAPQGVLVEQLTAKTFEQMLEEARGEAPPETLLKDVIDAIEAARDDERVQTLVLNLSSFTGARLTKLQDVGEAITNFKTSGKKVVAIADNFAQDAYYLAAHSDEIIMHKMGLVVLEGYGRYRMYYKEGIDKLGVDVHIFKVGTYKSAVEPYLRNDMSEFAREANQEWLGDLWQIYLDEVAVARGTTSERLDEYAHEFPRLMAAANGDPSRAALDAGLVDQALTRVEIREYLIGLVGENEETHSYNSVTLADYLSTLDEDRFGREAQGDTVGVIVARGTILDGTQPAGSIGGDSTAELIRQARNDENVKAIVLRVDSGGGSAFASEVIRRECEKARADGKPVIASMGSVAASGGFWISTSSDQIWAHPSTITGSIGIYGMIPTYQRPLAEYLGIRVDGISTAPLAGVRPDRELPAEVGEVIQAMIEQGYREFLQRVADSRGMTTEEVDRVAQGRVWSGMDAFDLGLVDQLGDLQDAIAAAAELAGLGEGYEVSYIEKQLEFKDKVLRDMMAEAAVLTAEDVSSASLLDQTLSRVKQAAAEIGELNDPNHVYALSNIETD
ncbi:MAG: signal peptide peptidase SppA [Xanthomonadales bacterium]|nr:signal peptide peptidase SppA [Gammaproteobacteria bacterium]MBT8051573.1 signal peptide peptidase SppA [Gammaproteobacteria bacterium]NNK52183.1 signal peptide peptidase SppA [Xanthomonadales bacterium]